VAVHRTTVEIDVEALSSARAALGTKTIKQTVNGALREVGRREALRRAARYVLDGKLHVPDELPRWASREAASGDDAEHRLA
jgi:Arc/MetJ family transcription regulator